MRRQKLKLSEYVPYLVNRLGSALVIRFSEDALARHNLSIALWRVLVALSDAGPQRQIDLSAIISADVSTLSRLITRLVRRGLVTRTRSSQSSREVIVTLTSRGENLVEDLIPVARRLERSAISGLSPAELRVAKAALAGMYQNLVQPKPAKTPAAKTRDRRGHRRSRQ
jgi:DNA-binding MarR family transcriptional regulator